MKHRTNPFNFIRLALVCTLTTMFSVSLFAKENIGKPPAEPGNDPPPPVILMKGAGCLPGTAQRDLDVNNVRTTILNGGDMWWNLSNARYEVPKVQTGQVAKHSLFSGALWIGGVTNGNLRIAAQTYRQSGNDYYPGALTIGTASVTAARCKDFDKIWKITLKEINDFRAEPTSWPSAPDEITTWPCEGNTGAGESQFLAPFFDYDGDGRYMPTNGDFPSFDPNKDDNIPDMMLFILYNDKGNIHSESEGVPIGLELHTQAFAYATNDEMNFMTFYRTTIFNRSNEIIDSCVFGQWVDPDLGNYSDDYVECDVNLSLGICYNGDDNDEGTLGYGLNPPSIGIRFFEGPRRPDSTEIGLTKFVYYNNDFSVTGNPSRPEHYWGYLNGRWKDGAPITYGGNGKGGADTASFMFPGDTDPAGRATWNERNSQNQPSDRRFLQTAGSFSLLPGAVNRVTIGVVWARASTGGATESFKQLKEASNKAFILFKNNFKLIDGPEAPVVEVVELKNKIVLKLLNTDPIENFTDSFQGECIGQKTVYKFQGYLVYQLKLPNTPTDYYDTEQARLIAQYDVVDARTVAINTTSDPDLGEVKKLMVKGENNGIVHSIEITKDAFESGTDQRLVNFKNYHYLVMSYATPINCPASKLEFLPGRNTIGNEGKGITVYTATPHDPAPRNGGTTLNADYGTTLPVSQLEGIGNGGNFIELSEQSINEALSEGTGYVAKIRNYQSGFGPIAVKVVDPIKLPEADFTLWMRDSSGLSTTRFDSLNASKTYWFIRNNTTGEVKAGTNPIGNPNEQMFNDWGISITINQSIMPGDAENIKDASNGYLDSKIIWEDPAQKWLSNITDEDPIYTQFGYGTQFNWIRSGNTGKAGTAAASFNNPEIHDFGIGGVALDPRRNYSKIIDGTWSPYALAAKWRTPATTPAKLPTFGPGWDNVDAIPTAFGAPPVVSDGRASLDNPIKDLHGIDLVITPDRSKWTRCVVVETGEDYRFNLNHADKMDRRKSLSVDKYGRTIKNGGDPNGGPESSNYLGDSSMGWFPGYAIDVETGERLNIMFGEDSSLPTENGTDMIWNPTSTLIGSGGRPVFGGKHYIYVMGSKTWTLGAGSSAVVYNGPRYDGGLSYVNKLDRSISTPAYVVRKRQVYSQVLWTSMPVLGTGFKLKDIYSGLVPGKITYKIRVKRPYAVYSNGGATVNDSMPLYSFSTRGFSPTISASAGKKALDNIAIVPNPYYAYSSYEDAGNQLDNRVRIVNLPPRVEIRIYTLDGVLVRTIKKDDSKTTYLEWNLKNDAQVPITSGIYLIHFKATDLGEERIVKWVGVMRPADYDSF